MVGTDPVDVRVEKAAILIAKVLALATSSETPQVSLPVPDVAVVEETDNFS